MIFWRIASAAQQQSQCSSRISVGTGVGFGRDLKLSVMECWHQTSHVGLMKLPSAIVTLGTIRPEDIVKLCDRPLCFSIKLHRETSDHLGMCGGKSPRLGKNPLSGE